MSKGGDSFHFREFTVRHDKCAMKVNTDAVVLGALTANTKETSEAKRILDIGTGSGILALMLAQKSSSPIDAVEVDTDSAAQASDNFNLSPWSNRLQCIHESFQNFYRNIAEQKYDLIISNPPYFEPQNLSKMNNQQQPSKERAQARFEDALPFAELVAGVKKLLLPEGSFYTILPFQRALEFTGLAVAEGLYLCRQTDIISKEDKSPSRVVLRFSKEKSAFIQSTLTLHDQFDKRTSAFIDLTKDYYLI